MSFISPAAGSECSNETLTRDSTGTKERERERGMWRLSFAGYTGEKWRLYFMMVLFVYKEVYVLTLAYLSELFTSYSTARNLRSADQSPQCHCTLPLIIHSWLGSLHSCCGTVCLSLLHPHPATRTHTHTLPPPPVIFLKTHFIFFILLIVIWSHGHTVFILFIYSLSTFIISSLCNACFVFRI